jgi:D-3-phosphoglycerate dehydrogenase
MDLLIVEPLEAEVLQWLDARHELFYAPRLPRDAHAFGEALASARAVLLPPAVGIDADAVTQARRLRAIGRIVGGPDNLDLAACAQAGVEVVRSTDAAAPAEAEFMLGALLALMRPSPSEVGRVAGRELSSSCVGLIGMTATARSMAGLLRPFGSRLVGYDPTLHASDAQWSRWGVQPLGLRELFENADAVCVQMSYYNRYRGLLGERALPHCKPNQVLVSVAPMALFNEEVLAEVLRSGRMTAAWLDCVSAGLLEAGQPLHGVRGLLVTPRLAAYTREARVRSAWCVARRIDEILRTTPDGVRAGPAPRRRSAELHRQHLQHQQQHMAHGAEPVPLFDQAAAPDIALESQLASALDGTDDDSAPAPPRLFRNTGV